MNLVKTAAGLQLTTPDLGKAVVFTPNTENDAQTLAKAAKAGYYYPLMALKHLKALSTGLTGKDNVFIPNINDFKTNSLQQVVVYVPGIVATVERRPNDVLAVTRLALSDEYASIDKASKQKPGVYSVSKEGNDIVVNYRSNGRITSKDDRKVVIADTSYSEPKLAAIEAKNRLDDMFGSSAALKCDFDLFYSPLGSKLKGMRNYNPAVVNKTYAFSGLLANAMEQSKNKKGVEWTSERAGSLVLTQSLMALASKNVSFKGQGHIVKMCWARSSPKPTYDAATKLGMLTDKNLLNSNSAVKATLSATIGNAARAKDKSDPYTWNDYGKELANGSMTFNTIIGAGALFGGLATGLPILTTAGTVTGGVGAFQLLYKTLKSRWDRG